MKNFKFLLDPMRLPFLILTPACVVLGLATAIWTSGHVNWLHFFLVLIGALSAHISVNTFNEYFDFKSGLDAKTIRTPFSGGSGMLPENPEMGNAALIMAWVFLALTGAIGIYFGFRIGLGINYLLLYRMDHPLPAFVFTCPGFGFWSTDGDGNKLCPHRSVQLDSLYRLIGAVFPGEQPAFA